MAFTRKTRRMFQTGSSGEGDYVSNTDVTSFSSSFADNEYLKDGDMKAKMGPMIYQMEMVKDDIEHINDRFSVELAAQLHNNVVSTSAISVSSSGNITFSNNLDVQGSFKLNQSSLDATTTTTLDLTTSVNFKISLGTDTTLAISNASSAIGQSGVIVFVQDATGGRTVTIPSSWKTPRGASISWDTGANSINIISYYVIDGSTIVINYMGDFS